MDISLSKSEVKQLPPLTKGGERVRCVTGVARSGGSPWSLYAVSWVPGKVPLHGATLRFSFPAWEGEDLDGERVEVCLDFLFDAPRLGAYLVDAWGESLSEGGAHPMAREEVVGTEVMEHTRKLLNTLWQREDNMAELRDLVRTSEVQTDGPAEAACKLPTAP